MRRACRFYLKAKPSGKEPEPQCKECRADQRGGCGMKARLHAFFGGIIVKGGACHPSNLRDVNCLTLNLHGQLASEDQVAAAVEVTELRHALEIVLRVGAIFLEVGV